MGSATKCPSRLLGKCDLGDKCYAYKAEVQYYKTCPQYRDKQAEVGLMIRSNL